MVNGPATLDVDKDVTDPLISSWLQQDDLEPLKLTVTIDDPVTLDYDGRYIVQHINGKSVESFELLICHVKLPVMRWASSQPIIDWASGQSEPYSIVRQSD